MPAITAALAATIVVALLWISRRNLVHPVAAFGVPWFLFAALAQLQLTVFERRWSASFAMLVLGGGLLVVVGIAAAGGLANAAVAVDRERYDASRLLIAAAVFAAAAAIGWGYKAHVIGTLPLFSGDIDTTRGRLFHTPPWSSLLTSGSHLSCWCLLAYVWLRGEQLQRPKAALLLTLAVATGATSFLGASRNELLLTVIVPAVVIYVLRPARAWRAALLGLGAVALGSAIFFVRVNQHADASPRYLDTGSGVAASLERSILPAYIFGAYPFEVERRLFEDRPEGAVDSLGGATLASLPRALFPDGKPQYHETVGRLSAKTSPGPYWTVATYQGRALFDYGWVGVLPSPFFAGIALGLSYRLCRGREGFFFVAVVGYIAYYSAFMVYDNLLSFSLVAFVDLGVIAITALLVRRGGLSGRAPVSVASV